MPGLMGFGQLLKGLFPVYRPKRGASPPPERVAEDDVLPGSNLSSEEEDAAMEREHQRRCGAAERISD